MNFLRNDRDCFADCRAELSSTLSQMKIRFIMQAFTRVISFCYKRANELCYARAIAFVKCVRLIMERMRFMVRRTFCTLGIVAAAAHPARCDESIVIALSDQALSASVAAAPPTLDSTFIGGSAARLDMIGGGVGNFSGVLSIRHDTGFSSVVQAATALALRAKLSP